ncbi:hypothetical protein D9M68_936750 [compost metagenome]
MLGPVQRLVRCTGHGQCIQPLVQLHHPCTEGALQIPRLRRVENFGKAPANFVQHLVCGVQRGIGHDDGKLFATVAANEVGLAQALLEE